MTPASFLVWKLTVTISQRVTKACSRELQPLTVLDNAILCDVKVHPLKRLLMRSPTDRTLPESEATWGGGLVSDYSPGRQNTQRVNGLSIVLLVPGLVFSPAQAARISFKAR